MGAVWGPTRKSITTSIHFKMSAYTTDWLPGSCTWTNHQDMIPVSQPFWYSYRVPQQPIYEVSSCLESVEWVEYIVHIDSSNLYQCVKSLDGLRLQLVWRFIVLYANTKLRFRSFQVICGLGLQINWYHIHHLGVLKPKRVNAWTFHGISPP